MKHWILPLVLSLALHAAVVLLLSGESLSAPHAPMVVLKARLVTLPAAAAPQSTPERQQESPPPPSESRPSRKNAPTFTRQEKPAARQAGPSPDQTFAEPPGSAAPKNPTGLPGAAPHSAETPETEPTPVIREATGPDILSRISPLYPLASRRKGEAGTVLLLVRLDTRGKILEISVRSTSGYPALDHSALLAVSRWKFRPEAPGLLLVPVVFKLE